jgi:hypothetical protein
MSTYSVGSDVVSANCYGNYWPTHPTYSYPTADSVKKDIAKKVLNDSDLTKDKKLELLKYILS